MFWMKAVKSGRARPTATMEPVGSSALLHNCTRCCWYQRAKATDAHQNITVFSKKMTYFSIWVQKVKLEFVYLFEVVDFDSSWRKKKTTFRWLWNSERYKLVQRSTHLSLNKAEGSMMSFLSSFSFLSQNKWALSKRICWYIQTLEISANVGIQVSVSGFSRTLVYLSL